MRMERQVTVCNLWLIGRNSRHFNVLRALQPQFSPTNSAVTVCAAESASLFEYGKSSQASLRKLAHAGIGNPTERPKAATDYKDFRFICIEPTWFEAHPMILSSLHASRRPQ
jgi:hypothetical protein